jgi:ribosomal protein S18 acetylase RimI-like enzyme
VQGAYILNVVVEEESRGQGIGKALMFEAMSRAVHMWGAKTLYTHVEATNEVGGRCEDEEHEART